MRCLHRVPDEAMMSLMSGVLGMHGHARGPRVTGHVAVVGLEPQHTWWYRSPAERWSWCLGHVATPEPSYAGAGLEPRGTWRLQSPLLPGDGLGASRHMCNTPATPGLAVVTPANPLGS
jgi:hypothetical protein